MNFPNCPGQQIPTSCANEVMNTKNVFTETDDMSIRYRPYQCSTKIGDTMEDTFQKKCCTKTNTFFYPTNPLDFFKKDNHSFNMYKHCVNQEEYYYNRAWNEPSTTRRSDLLGDRTSTERFFNNTSGPVFANDCQEDRLTTGDKYTTAFDQSVDRLSCSPETLPCDRSFVDTTMI